MMPRLLLLAFGCLNLVGMSGCCLYCPLFCHSCSSYYGYGGCGYAGGYAACVTSPGFADCTAGCGECAPGGCGAAGVYGPPMTPAQYARMQRIARRNVRRAAASGYGYDMLGYGDPLYGCNDLCFDGLCGVEACGGCSTCGTSVTGVTGGAPCNCQNDAFTSGGWTQSEWVEVTPQPAPQPLAPTPRSHEAYSPQAAPPTPMNGGGSPQPMDMTRDHYYMPSPMAVQPAAHPQPQTRIENSTGGSPLQPVLWVPNGL